MPLTKRDKQKPRAVEIAKALEMDIFNNFGVEKFERLPVNIVVMAARVAKPAHTRAGNGKLKWRVGIIKAHLRLAD